MEGQLINLIKELSHADITGSALIVVGATAIVISDCLIGGDKSLTMQIVRNVRPIIIGMFRRPNK